MIIGGSMCTSMKTIYIWRPWVHSFLRVIMNDLFTVSRLEIRNCFDEITVSIISEKYSVQNTRVSIL